MTKKIDPCPYCKHPVALHDYELYMGRGAVWCDLCPKNTCRA